MLIRVFLIGLLSVVVTSCKPGLLFKNDHRITILYPENHSSVKEPVKIEWKARDFTPGTDGRFAVFIDRDPMPPGESIDHFPFAQRTQGIFILDAYSLEVELFTRRSGVDSAERDHHDVTVVIVDKRGRRLGETAGFTEFTVIR